MKWTLLLAFTLAITAGCSKSNIKDEEVSLKASGDPSVKNNLTGTWRLVEYFQDIGDGTGHWVAATDPDQITFNGNGEISFSSNSMLAGRGYNRYRIIDGNHVELYSASSNDIKEIFYYNRETGVYLVFNPQCRENCSRRYKLVD